MPLMQEVMVLVGFLHGSTVVDNYRLPRESAAEKFQPPPVTV